MSRSGSRYPSAFGHTPSYRSYVRGTSGLDSDLSYPSARSSALGAGSSALGSSALGGSSAFGGSGLGGSSAFDLSLPSTSFDVGNNYSGSNVSSKVTSSSYSSMSDSSRDGGRPVVEYSKSSDYRGTTTGTGGVPRTSISHASSSYSSEDPYKNRVNSYSYNI